MLLSVMTREEREESDPDEIVLVVRVAGLEQGKIKIKIYLGDIFKKIILS